MRTPCPLLAPVRGAGQDSGSRDRLGRFVFSSMSPGRLRSGTCHRSFPTFYHSFRTCLRVSCRYPGRCQNGIMDGPKGASRLPEVWGTTVLRPVTHVRVWRVDARETTVVTGHRPPEISPAVPVRVRSFIPVHREDGGYVPSTREGVEGPHPRRGVSTRDPTGRGRGTSRERVS